MIAVLLTTLAALWLLGYINIQGLSVPHAVLFSINSQPITLRDILIFIIISWIIGILPSPFREVAIILFVLLLLSTIGIIAISGLSNLLVIAIIVGLIFYLLRGAS